MFVWGTFGIGLFDKTFYCLYVSNGMSYKGFN